MRTKQLSISRQKRLDFYKLLSDCYYLPDEDLMKRLTDSEKLNGEWGDLEPLRVDFARLFVGPFKLLAAPYGSVYLDNTKTLMTPSTIDVRKKYEEEGLEINIKEVPDHIAIELEFMYFLIFKETEATEDENCELASEYVHKQASFLKMHLSRWVFEFCDNVESQAQTSFYKNLAKVTKLFIEEDLRGLYLPEALRDQFG